MPAGCKLTWPRIAPIQLLVSLLWVYGQGNHQHTAPHELLLEWLRCCQSSCNLPMSFGGQWMSRGLAAIARLRCCTLPLTRNTTHMHGHHLVLESQKCTPHSRYPEVSLMQTAGSHKALHHTPVRVSLLQAQHVHCCAGRPAAGAAHSPAASLGLQVMSPGLSAPAAGCVHPSPA